jgi:hypothetical protein
VTQALDLVLQLQLFPLEFRESQIIDRWVQFCIVQFTFDGLMPFLEFREMGLHVHAVPPFARLSNPPSVPQLVLEAKA